MYLSGNMIQLVVESWIWYAVTVFVVICRFVSRALTFGSIKRYQIDDYLMILAICTYTVDVVALNIVADATSNLLPPGFDVNTLTPQDIAEREYGSKMILVVEQMQIATIWLLKACLLIMYYRLTKHLKQNLWVKVLAVYVAVGFVVMEILYFGVWCRPFTNYWAVPTPNVQCSAATDHLITNAVFNISSDLIMLCIGLSLFIRSKLPLKRKAILCGIFSIGIFVILAAVLNKYYSFSHPFGSMWCFWYDREVSTAMIVASLPFLWTLLRRLFKLGAFDPNGPPSQTYYSARTARGRQHQAEPIQGSDTSSSQKSNTPNGTLSTQLSAGGPDDHGRDWVARPDLKLVAKPRMGGRGYVPVKGQIKKPQVASQRHKRGQSDSSAGAAPRTAKSRAESRPEVDVEEGQVRPLEPWESVELEPWESISPTQMQPPISTMETAYVSPLGRGYAS